jgi:hypothetical protein|tara:strand:- start:3644 stop:3787 length:144 start_codon:yes stop_codon:yes gene_type:complete
MGKQVKKHGYSAKLVRVVERDTTDEMVFYNNEKPSISKPLKQKKTGL